MKTQVLFQVLLSVCLLIATTCYGQTGYKLEDLKVEKTGYDLQGTLLSSESYVWGLKRSDKIEIG